MPYHWILVPVISAGVGWIIYRVAIWLLFRPREPHNLLGIKIQGFFPKKQQQLSEQLGRLAAREFFSFGDIARRVADPANVQKIMPQVEEHIDLFLRVRLPAQMPVISMFIGDKTISELKTVFTAEMETLFPVVMNGYMNTLQEDLDLEKLIAEKLAGLSSRQLEQALRSVMKRQFRLLELAGAVLGLVVGIIAVLLAGL
jgi:uncharacterized membrane protein YheB (UPF0754 family)